MHKALRRRKILDSRQSMSKQLNKQMEKAKDKSTRNLLRQLLIIIIILFFMVAVIWTQISMQTCCTVSQEGDLELDRNGEK